MSVALESREFLTSCLRAALDDPDLVDAVSDQANEQGFSAVSIGKGAVSVEQLKAKLYLTVEEATAVLNICASMIAGHQTKPQEQADNGSLNLKSTMSGCVALNLISSSKEHQPAEPIKQEAYIEAVAFEPLEAIMEKAAVVVVSRTPVKGSAKKLGVESGLSTPPPPSAPISSASPTPVHMASPAPAPITSPAPAPIASSAQSSTASPAPAPVPVPSSPATAPPAVRPAMARSTSTPKPSDLVLPVEQHSPPLASPTATSSPMSAPSYLRPTAAHKARASKDGGAQSKTMSPAPGLAPVSEESRDLTRRRSLFSRVTSTLLAPTQAFVARVTGRNEETKGKKDTAVSKTSAQLDAVLCSPQGQRTTKPQPFLLRSDARSKSCVLSTEDLILAEAREKAFKRNPVPKHVHESRPIAPVQRSSPKDPKALCEPFQLASVELHKKNMEKRRQKLEEEAAREEEARKFKARAFDAKTAVSPAKPAKPPASPPTRAVAPKFASDARMVHYKNVIEPAKKAKEAEANKEKLEAEQKAKELEEMSMEDFRKTLEFKARPMPNFSAPFQPDPNLARPVTTPSEPELHTVKRLGAAPANREDKEGPGLGKGVYDGAGYVDPFSASLRKSSSASSHNSINGGSVAGSKRRSAVSMLRQSTGSGSFGGSRMAPRASVGNDLQAAIRAAARDAARDLEAAGCSVGAQSEGGLPDVPEAAEATQ